MPVILICYALPALLGVRGLLRRRLIGEAIAVVATTLATLTIAVLLAASVDFPRPGTTIDALFSSLVPKSLRAALGFRLP